MLSIFPCILDIQIRSDQSLSRVRFFVTPWIAARQASLSPTNSRSSLRLTPIESVMPSSHLILCNPLLLLPPNPSQHQSLFQWVNSSHEVAKVLHSISIASFNYKHKRDDQSWKLRALYPMTSFLFQATYFPEQSFTLVTTPLNNNLSKQHTHPHRTGTFSDSV